MESENAVNKWLGDAKMMGYELVTRLIDQADVQHDLEALRI